MTVPHFSEYELDRLAAGEKPNERQRAALEAVPALRAALEERKQSLGAFPHLDERQLLAQIRTKASEDESSTASLGGRVFHWREALLGAVAMAALFGVGQVVFEKEPVNPPEQIATNASPPPSESARPEIRPVVLADGSRIIPQEGGQVGFDRVTSSLVALRLREGSARLEVTKNPARDFQVRIENVLVRVVGTKFTVSRGNGSVEVTVSEGRVRVEGPAGEAEVSAGESQNFPYQSLDDREQEEILEALDKGLVQEVELPTTHGPPRHGDRSTRSSRNSRNAEAPAAWKALVEAGDHDAAFEAIQSNESAVGNGVGDLLLAADAARLSGHPEAALSYLERVLQDHPKDPRAPSAAYTLGKIYLQTKDNNRAAELFAKARALAPQGPLASDALAREVQAWSRTSDHAKARARAEEYVRLYPNGDQIQSVKRHGGLE